MTKLKKALCLCMAIVCFITVFAGISIIEGNAASYPKIPAFQITRIYQPDYDTNGMCYWSSMATVQGYCLGTYTYGGVTTNYRVAGKDYDYLKRGDAVTKLFKDGANGYANDYNNLTKFYPVKMTRVTEGIGKNAATYEKIYNQLAQGKPVVVYTGTHASVVIGYNGSATTLQPSGFTVMEIKKDGKWWSNSADYYKKHANSPQVDSAKGSYMSCYVTLDSWISYCGGKLKEICYPTNAINTASQFTFNANGGTGTMNGFKVDTNGTFTVPETSFTYDGFTFKGYNVLRKCDSTYYGNAGWKNWQSIVDNQYENRLYVPGESYTFGAEWLKDGGVAGGAYEFIAVWAPDVITVNFYGNYSRANYMMTPKADTFAEYYQSRNKDVYTVEYQREDGKDMLKITGTEAGGAGKDLLFKTQTNQGINYNYNSGDNKDMFLRMKVKGSAKSANMVFRWGYTSDTVSVPVTDSWTEVCVDMSKQPNDGAHMHPYFDRPGEYLISDICLVDMGTLCPAAPETADIIFTENYAKGGEFAYLPTPERENHNFVGWFTAKTGGEQITETTPVFDAHTALYARWEVKDEPSEPTEPDTNPTDNSTYPVPTETTPVQTESKPTEAETQPTEESTVTLSVTVLMGDVDFSGKVNIRDATKIQKALAKFETLDDIALFSANVVDDNKVSIKDATAIQKYCAFMEVDAEINVNSIYFY